MNKYFFYKLSVLFFLLFLKICCALLAFSQHAGVNTAQASTTKSVTLFNLLLMNDVLTTDGTPGNVLNGGFIEPQDFYSSFLLTTKDLIVALTGVNVTDGPEENLVVLTSYIETTGEKDNWINKTTETTGNVGKNWQKQLALNEKWKDTKSLKFLFAAAHNNQIHILLVNTSAVEGKNADKSDIALKWVHGNISATADSATPGRIKWNAETQLGNNILAELDKKLAGKLLDKNLSNGYVLLTEKGNFFFVLQFDLESNKKTFAFIQFENSEATVNFAHFEVKNSDCSFKLFTWKEKIMLAKYCGDKGSSIQELKDKDGEKEWKDTDEPVSRLLYHLQDRNNFTAASINNESVLLFTQQKTDCKNTEGKNYCVDLWMTDGSRLYNVGPIVTGKNAVIFAGLLYTKKQLFSLHRETGNSKNMVFTHLQDQLEKINATLDQWKDSNKKVQEICKTITFFETACTTDGLVGFLSGRIEPNNQWINEYLGVGATAHKKNDKTNNDAVTFSGVGAGAEWPVGKTEKEDQPYIFADSGFTLVATVIPGSTNGDQFDNSVLGVGSKGNTNKIGLWCTTHRKWTVKVGDAQEQITTSAVDCEPRRTYYVALILNDTKLSIYVDGETLTGLENKKIEKGDSITHFYFGTDNKEKQEQTDVTISNVLLYNQPLIIKEIKELKPKEEKETTNTLPSTTNDGSQQQENNGITAQTNSSTPNTSTTENNEKVQSTSPPTTTEDSAVRGGVVRVLCFMLFGVFTLLGRYVH